MRERLESSFPKGSLTLGFDKDQLASLLRWLAAKQPTEAARNSVMWGLSTFRRRDRDLLWTAGHASVVSPSEIEALFDQMLVRRR